MTLRASGVSRIDTAHVTATTKARGASTSGWDFDPLDEERIALLLD